MMRTGARWMWIGMLGALFVLVGRVEGAEAERGVGSEYGREWVQSIDGGEGSCLKGEQLDGEVEIWIRPPAFHGHHFGHVLLVVDGQVFDYKPHFPLTREHRFGNGNRQARVPIPGAFVHAMIEARNVAGERMRYHVPNCPNIDGYLRFRFNLEERQKIALMSMLDLWFGPSPGIRLDTSFNYYRNNCANILPQIVARALNESAASNDRSLRRLIRMLQARNATPISIQSRLLQYVRSRSLQVNQPTPLDRRAASQQQEE